MFLACDLCLSLVAEFAEVIQSYSKLVEFLGDMQIAGAIKDGMCFRPIPARALPPVVDKEV
ncbi:hypothetical protein DFAR_3690059 [Desulfarculales bacterium]